MSIEDFKPFQQIEAENIADHEKELEEQLLQAELAFAELKYQQQKEGESVEFADILEKYTPVIKEIERKYMNKENMDAHENHEEIRIFLENTKKNINDVYNVHGLGKVKSEIDNYSERYYSPDPVDKKIPQIGFVQYNSIDPEQSDRGNIKLLQNEGFSKYDEALEIHMDDKFKNPESGLNIKEINKSFGELAKTLIKDYPSAQAVMGTSWLMNHPLFKKLGFKIIETDVADNGPESWLQLIDKNGQINQSRLAKLMETGEMPYKVKTGYMKTEDFLQRYLPAENRGEINLKKINPANAERKDQLTAEVSKFKQDWDKEIKEHKINTTEFVKNYPAFVSLMEATNQKDEYLEVLQSVSDKGYTWAEIRTNNPFGEEIGNKFQEYMNHDKYLDKKVVIE